MPVKFFKNLFYFVLFTGKLFLCPTEIHGNLSHTSTSRRPPDSEGRPQGRHASIRLRLSRFRTLSLSLSLSPVLFALSLKHELHKTTSRKCTKYLDTLSQMFVILNTNSCLHTRVTSKRETQRVHQNDLKKTHTHTHTHG